MSEHHPLPWTYEPYSSPPDRGFVADANDRTVAGHLDRDVAQLLAASPDLLALASAVAAHFAGTDDLVKALKNASCALQYATAALPDADPMKEKCAVTLGAVWDAVAKAEAVTSTSIAEQARKVLEKVKA